MVFYSNGVDCCAIFQEKLVDSDVCGPTAGLVGLLKRLDKAFNLSITLRVVGGSGDVLNAINVHEMSKSAEVNCGPLSVTTVCVVSHVY